MEKKIIEKKDVEYLSQLIRIELKEDEKESLVKEIGKIIEYISKLNEINTENIEPTYHVIPIKNVFREDIPENYISREKMLKNAPDKDNNFFKVPRII
ncbi:MAG: Asp-tRNA(Asn)/Glu-tRNA(Gln) amidotransferase subunit GatC [Candidatus Omnitrophica bacterium]|nr:Asp-tRNA(Asn)/Glu-tRNA(Gln) amidotransferase subunit GatC [Candidatus Omnitrophota bacterium]